MPASSEAAGSDRWMAALLMAVRDESAALTAGDAPGLAAAQSRKRMLLRLLGGGANGAACLLKSAL